MRYKNSLLAVLSFLLFIAGSYAQGPGEWSTSKAHPCYQGITVSVVNMGKGSGDNDYLWGVKFTNYYPTGVTFRYKLSIGEPITSSSGGDGASLKKRGDTWVDGNDKFRAKLYHNPSEEWYVYIWDVCFEGMRCGGADECYADCDKDSENPKPNQLCGLSSSPSLNAPETNNAPKEMRGEQAGPDKEEDETPNVGETSNWQRDDKQVEIMMGKTEKGIYWKRKNDKKYTFFEKLPSGAYRYEVGNDTYIIQFVSATKIQFSENGTVTNHYNLIAEEDDGESKVRSGLWSLGLSNVMVRITVMKDGLTYHRINNSSDDGTPFYKRISATEYRRYEADGILYDALTLKEDGRLYKTFTDKPGSYVNLDVLVFSSAEDETKPGAETNGDKYMFKGTTVWKSQHGNYFDIYAMIENGLYGVEEGGGPWNIPWQLQAKDPLYDRIKPDVYQWISDAKTSTYINTFISGDKLQHELYAKNGKKLMFRDIKTLVTTWSENLLPKATSQTISPVDVVGNWKYEVKYDRSPSIESLQVVSNDAGTIVIKSCTGNNECSSDIFSYKKISANAYEFKPKESGTARLVFLSPTRICLSYVYKNYVSIGYYNKPAAAPIVKQENKPVTENKTVTGGCPELSGEWLAVEDNVYHGENKSTYSYPVTITTTSQGISWSAPSKNQYAICKKVSAISYRCDFGSEWGGYYGILSCNNNSYFLQLYRPDGSSDGVTRYKLQRK